MTGLEQDVKEKHCAIIYRKEVLHEKYVNVGSGE